MGRHFPRIDLRKRFILNLDIVNNPAEDLPNDAGILKAARIDTALEYDCVGHERRYSVILGWRQRGVSAQSQAGDTGRGSSKGPRLTRKAAERQGEDTESQRAIEQEQKPVCWRAHQEIRFQ
jgi:hypothetical protein